LRVLHNDAGFGFHYVLRGHDVAVGDVVEFVFEVAYSLFDFLVLSLDLFVL
jgi:hypothetical protein